MPFELFLALRMLRSRRGRLARVTALAGACGIACGVAALIIALALANGFRDEMRDKILRGTAHITLTRRNGAPVRDWRATIERARRVDGVTDATATSYEGALLSREGNATYAIIRGVDAESARAVAEVRRALIAGAVEPLLRHDTATTTTMESRVPRQANDLRDPTRATPHDAGSIDESPFEAIIGAELAERMRLSVGDRAELITGERAAESNALTPRARRIRIAGIFRTGLYEYDSAWLYVSLADAGEIAGTPGAASVISLEVADIYASARVAERVRATLGNGEWTTVDWQEANRPLFAALALERRTVGFIIALIILVSALNITTTLALLVVERRADIAVLGAMGARAASITRIFIIEGALIGASGAGAGVALGLAACWAGNRFRLISLPSDVYSLSSIPFHARARDVLLAALVAFVVSLLATLYPARAAVRTRPAEALRYE